MPQPLPENQVNTRLKEFAVQSWRTGVVTSIPTGQVPFEGLVRASNMTLTRTGGLRPRPSLIPYGSGELPGKLIGQLHKYRYDGTSNLVGCFDDAGTIKVANKTGESGAWVEFALRLWTNTNSNPIGFQRVGDNLLITGGDVSTTAGNSIGIVDLTDTKPAIYTPKALSSSAMGTPVITVGPGLVVTAGEEPVATYQYRITARSNYGETDPIAITRGGSVSKNRIEWDISQTANPENITLQWDRVADATGYNVYFSIDGITWGLLAQTNQVSSGTKPSYEDDGQIDADYLRPSPFLSDTSNSTKFPDCTYAVATSNRVILYGDRNNIGRIHYSGFDNQILNFSRSLDSNYIDLSVSGEEVISMLPFRSNTGLDGVVAFTTEEGAGDGARYTLTPVQIQTPLGLENTYSRSPSSTIGTNSPYGVVRYQDSLYYPTKTDFKTTGNQPSIQNLVATDNIAQTIEDQIHRLNYRHLSNISGTSWQEKIYWAITTAGTTNNEVWVLDLTQQQGSWMTGWDIEADCLITTPDENGREELLVIKDDTVKKFVYIDRAERFKWSAKSALIRNPGSKLQKMQVAFAYFVIHNLVGNVRLTVTGRTRKGFETLLDTALVGWGEEISGTGGWGVFDFLDPPEWGEIPEGALLLRRGDSTIFVVLNPRLECMWLRFEIESDDEVYSDFVMSDFVLYYVDTGPMDFKENLPIQ